MTIYESLSDVMDKLHELGVTGGSLHDQFEKSICIIKNRYRYVADHEIDDPGGAAS